MNKKTWKRVGLNTGVALVACLGSWSAFAGPGDPPKVLAEQTERKNVLDPAEVEDTVFLKALHASTTG